MDEQKNRKCLEILEEVLRNNIPEGHYCLNGYSEESCCIEKEGEKYIFYIGERNQKKDLIRFDNALEACLKLLNELSYLKSDVKNIYLEALL